MTDSPLTCATAPPQTHSWPKYNQSPTELVACIGVGVDGNLDRDRLEAAIRTVTLEHDILRTVVIGNGLQQPIQQVNSSNRQPSLELVDLTALSESDQQSKISEVCDARIAQNAGDSEQASPQHILFKLSSDRCGYVALMPSLLMDGEGLSLFLTTICEQYASTSSDATSEQPVDDTLQYNDYAEYRNTLSIQ